MVDLPVVGPVGGGGQVAHVGGALVVQDLLRFPFLLLEKPLGASILEILVFLTMLGCAVKLRRAREVIRGQSGFSPLSFTNKVSINICCVAEAWVAPGGVGGVDGGV